MLVGLSPTLFCTILDNKATVRIMRSKQKQILNFVYIHFVFNMRSINSDAFLVNKSVY